MHAVPGSKDSRCLLAVRYAAFAGINMSTMLCIGPKYDKTSSYTLKFHAKYVFNNIYIYIYINVYRYISNAVS